ncbi:MAG: hypothetical protein LBR68_05780, partial [Lachnoclostridium sp.]|nr:hypothetical protein [Lachnoclostridium sp.]
DTTYALTTPDMAVNYNLPSSANQLAIPITIVDGKGEVTLTPYPFNYSKFDHMSASVHTVMKDQHRDK